nr:ribonuclease H-like domain, reverse transcriptase, RNA-dependent DNA polymerase [Tanacetum cinerariifolium]
MNMEHYLSHRDYPIWQVIHNGNGLVSVITDTNGMIKVLPPKTAKEVMARKRERKARTTLLMALPEDHLAKFHKIVDAKEMWEAIKSRFYRNDKSKKTQKYLLKQQFKGFSVSSSEGLHKGYDRSLPSSWSHVALIMRTKPGLDTLGFDDLYNNLRVFECDVKGTTTSLSNIQNVTFVSANNTSSTNDVSTAYSVSSPSVLKSHNERSSSYTDEVIHSFFENQSSDPQLYYDDLEQINNDDMEEIAKRTLDSRRRDPGYNGNKARDNSKIHAYQDDSKALVTIDGKDIDWSRHESDLENTSVNDRYAARMHAVPPPMIGNSMPSGPDDDLHRALKDKGIVDSGCSRHMTGNTAHLADYQEFKELKHYNLFSVSQMCDKKNNVLFTNTDCLVLSPDFKLSGENQDETTPILNDFIRQAKNQFNHKVKTIMSDNGIEFKNHDLIEFCGLQGIKREYSNAITPQQNGVAKRKNETLIELAITMLAYSFLPIIFWAEAVNNACYVLNRVLLTKPQNKIPYELLTGPKEANNSAGTQATDDQGANSKEIDLHKEQFLLPIWSAYSTTVKSLGNKIAKNTDFKSYEKPVSQVKQIFRKELEKLKRQKKEANVAARQETTHANQDANTNSTNLLNADIYASPSERIFTDSSYDDEGVVWIPVDLPFRKKAIRTKWVYRNKNDERRVVVRNNERLVAQGHRQEEGIDYDEVFASMARIEAIRIFLAFTSYMGFIVYQMDVKSALLYGTIDEEVYVTQPPGFVDLKFPNKVYKVVKALYGLHQAPRACVKTASTPTENQKPLVKDEEAADVDVTPKTSHLQAMKRIFRYLKGQYKLGLWYPKVSSFDLKAYSDSDYAGANLDRKSTREAKYVAAAHYCGQVLWIQNQQLDYGSNLMNTKIYIDNESTICIVKNPVFHSKTKHIIIWHHFIRDVYEKNLIHVLKIHIDDNVDDLLNKAFDVSRIFECCSYHHTTNGHQFTMSNPHQELTSPEANGFCKELASLMQTALGKDNSNLLIVDSLLKTIWLSMHHIIAMKHWLFQSKQLLANVSAALYTLVLIKAQQHISNESPLSGVNTPRCDEDSFKLMELMIHLIGWSRMIKEH